MEALNLVTIYLCYLEVSYNFEGRHKKKTSYATYGHTYPSYKTCFFLMFFFTIFPEKLDFHHDFEYVGCVFLCL